MNEAAADTRTRLLEAGLDHFGRVGFEGANIRAIAAAAGANIAAINYHFGGKRGLYLAVANHIVLESPAWLAGAALTSAVLTAALEACWYGLATGVPARLVLLANLQFPMLIRPFWI